MTHAAVLLITPQINRPVSRSDFVKLLKKLLNLSLAPHVVDLIFAVFPDGAGNLDTTTFLQVGRMGCGTS